MVAGQLAPPHAVPVVHDGQRGRRGVGGDSDRRGARIERVGDDLGEDRLLGGPGVGVAQVLQEVEEVDPSLAHALASARDRFRHEAAFEVEILPVVLVTPERVKLEAPEFFRCSVE